MSMVIKYSARFLAIVAVNLAEYLKIGRAHV